MHLSQTRAGVRLPTAERGIHAVVLLCLALLLLGLSGQPPEAQGATDTRYFGVGNQAFGATNAFAIVPAVGDRVAVVRTLAVLTDLGPGRITVYTNGPPAVLVSDSGTGNTNYQVTSGTGAGGTNGFAAGDNVIIAIGNTPTDTYTRARVAAVTTTNITVFPLTAPAATAVAGSLLYRLGTNQVLVGVTNQATSFNGSGIVTVGQRGQPLCIDIWGTSACFINALAGEYLGGPDSRSQ